MFRTFLPAYIWSVLIVVLLCLPGSDIPKVPSFKGIDKIAHIGLFAISQYLWMRPRIYQRNALFKSMNLKIGLILSAGGIFLEFIQLMFIPNRSFEVNDIAADMIGVLMGGVLVAGQYRRKKKPL